MELLLGYLTGSIDTQDKFGRTALFYAAAKGHDRLTQWFLSQNASPHTQDRYGSTPLCAAVRNGHAQIVELLLPLADATEFQDGLGQKLVWWASRSRCPEVVQPVQEWAQKMGLSIRESDLAGKPPSGCETTIACDVCTRTITSSSAFYHCSGCCNFDVCLECHELGGKCLRRHTLGSRTCQ